MDRAWRIILHIIRESADNKWDKTRIALQYVQQQCCEDGEPYIEMIDRHGPDDGWSIDPVSMGKVRMVIASRSREGQSRVEIQWEEEDFVDPIGIRFELGKLFIALEITGDDQSPFIDIINIVDENEENDFDDHIMLLYGVDSRKESRLIRRLIK